MKDIHYHIMEPFALVAPERFYMPTLENARCLVESLDLYGLEKANIPAISLYEPEDFVCNPLALYAKTLAPGRIYALAGLRYTLQDQPQELLEQARFLMSCGFDGFKMICKPNARRKMNIRMDDPLFEAFFAEAERQQWPILYHVGDPAEFWDPEKAPDWCRANGWYYGDEPHLPAYEGLYEEVEGFMKKHPLLRITFAHFFFLSWNLERLDALFQHYPNVRVDVTPGREMYVDFAANPEKTRAFFAKHKGRLMLGTDNDARNGEERMAAEKAGTAKLERLRTFYETDRCSNWGTEQLRGIRLPEDVLHALYEGAFDAFMGGRTPHMVNRDQAKELCRQLRPTAASSKAWHSQLEALYDALENAF